ncbi:MAG: hypothetical protein R3B70_36530 [Polyangiaceae bacterium]
MTASRIRQDNCITIPNPDQINTDLNVMGGDASGTPAMTMTTPT